MVNFAKLVVSMTALIPLIAALPVDNAPSETYIISFKREAAESDIASHFDFANEVHARSLARRGLTKRDEEGIRHKFSIREYRSYSGVFDRSTIEEIARHPAVDAVEADQIFYLDEVVDDYTTDSNEGDLFTIDKEDDVFTIDKEDDVFTIDGYNVLTQTNSPWGLASVSLNQALGVSANVTRQYRYFEQGSGQGTYSYVIDSGIRITHQDFEGRAKYGANFVANETNQDMNGHGTHVAGTVGGKIYGVAKKTNLIAVKVIHAGGATTSSVLIQGFQWVHDHAIANNVVKKSVINISIGGPSSQAYINAMAQLHKAGFAVFVSAGNDNKDACLQSPANADAIATVGSIAPDNSRSTFSNWGKCVDLFAPGTGVVSCGYTSDTAVATKSGTSMAAPHAAGEGAALKSLFGTAVDAPNDLYRKMVELGYRNIVKDPKGSFNLLLANGIGATK